ncbi:unnamed protein product [Echinostoma caproni]|uniref:Uncharacterized protein n=1 Tax=Echinostoma caproni TaxID=27848 RepID=A0A183AZ59_9TREM|nr:unnamed protein product [Echinostoma caproni]
MGKKPASSSQNDPNVVNRHIPESTGVTKTRSNGSVKANQRITMPRMKSTPPIDTVTKGKTRSSQARRPSGSGAGTPTSTQSRDQSQEHVMHDEHLDSQTTTWVDADVTDTDYCRAAYTASNQNDGFVPYHRPESRQRKHTGFTPPPEVPKPQTKRKSQPAPGNQNPIK